LLQKKTPCLDHMQKPLPALMGPRQRKIKIPSTSLRLEL